MERLFILLQQMYNDVLIGVPFAQNSCDSAALLNPPVDSLQQLLAREDKSCLTCILQDDENFSTSDSITLNVDDKPNPVESIIHSGFGVREITLLQLTLIKMVFTKVQLHEVEAEIKQSYLEIIAILQKEANVDSKLICLLCSSDRQLSYQTSKTLVSIMHFQLTKESSLSNICLIFYSKALSQFPSCNHLAECLWTLTNLIREILKDEILCKEDGLKKFLTPLDGLLEGFYNRIMSYSCGSHQGDLVSVKVTNDLSNFLDLLELIVASRIQMPLNFACQRMLFLNASCILHLAASPVHNLVKKKSVMLLKKCILYKAGDDQIKGRVAPFCPDPNFAGDRLLLASAVLQFVITGCLDQLFVNRKTNLPQDCPIMPEVGVSNNPDQVTLRALSLVLLKTLEIKIQDSASKVEAQALLESIMCPLLTFLESHLRLPRSVHLHEHPCMWLSVLFMEQDDDMLEAAKALLMVHLTFERFQHKVGFTLSDGTQDTLTHQNGCNPHCIFLFLLKNIAFDATVLLDFLISSETCFLEYFVRYLKFLVQDWYHFVKISEFFKTASRRDLGFPLEILSCHGINTNRSDMNLQSTAYTPLPYCELVGATSQALQSSTSYLLSKSYSTPSSEAFQSLVDYESSDDSETEWATEDFVVDMNERPLTNQSCSKAAVLDVVNPSETSKQDKLALDQKSLNLESPSDNRISFSDLGSAEGILEKTIGCLQQLQDSISRLHARNLFPYNPGALLNLLTLVNIINREHRFDSKLLKPEDMQDPPSACS